LLCNNLGQELVCDICLDKKWNRSTINFKFMIEENAFESKEEVRYLFECKDVDIAKTFEWSLKNLISISITNISI
jgi:hypothetical protein